MALAQTGKIPQGRRYRVSGSALPQEVEAIRDFANHIEPVEPTEANQSNIVSASSPKRRV